MQDDETPLQDLTSDLLKVFRAALPGMFSDAVLWTDQNDTVHVALVGNAEKVARVFGMTDVGGEPDRRVGRWILSALKTVAGIKLQPWEESAWVETHQLPEVLERLGGQTVWSWAEQRDVALPEEGVRIGFIPDPGYPWPTDTGYYWSATLGLRVRSERPAWVIEVEDPDEPGFSPPRMRLGVNPCLVFPPDETKTTPGGPVCGNLNGLPIVLTHCMQLGWDTNLQHKQVDQAADAIRACGGLLFPSLAAGPIPATNFGPVVLVAHLELLLDSLSPYRGRSKRRPCWVYGSDAWTTTTGELMKHTAAKLFDELHGDDTWMFGQTMDVLGIPPSSKTPGDWVDPLRTTKQLYSSLRPVVSRWRRDLTQDEFVELSEELTGEHKYAYAEAKAREVVRIDEFPFIIAPKSMRQNVERFADRVGYRGEVLVLPSVKHMGSTRRDLLVGGSTETRDYALYQWAWIVGDTIRKLRPEVKILT